MQKEEEDALLVELKLLEADSWAKYYSTLVRIKPVCCVKIVLFDLRYVHFDVMSTVFNCFIYQNLQLLQIIEGTLLTAITSDYFILFKMFHS